MSNPIQILMAEHRLIEELLASLGGLVARAQNQGEISRSAVAKFADFFSQYADRCHHGKEEDLVFARMEQRGASAEAGPVAVMLDEHVQGRDCIDGLRQVGAGTGPISDKEREVVYQRSTEYIDLLRNHIVKEDRVLFPMAIRLLSGADMTDLAVEVEAFEALEVESGERDRLRDLARNLMMEYPPAWSTGASCEECAGCGAA